MTAEKEYLIYLLSCFLNGTAPEGREVNWEEIYRLADINDIGGIVQNEIMLLPEEYRPGGETKSKFKQQMGFDIRNYEYKRNVIAKLKSFFNENSIDYILVKGAVISECYHVKELRTSGDIDCIVRTKDFNELSNILSENSKKYSFNNIDVSSVVINLKCEDVLVEIHRDADVLTDYFDDIFSLTRRDEINANCCVLDEYDHLLFLICHLAKHLKEKGAGIRMLADLDVLIRNIDNFDENRFYSLCEKAGIRPTAEALLSFINRCFNTPVSNINDCNGVYDLFLDSLICGGSFNHTNSSVSQIHLNNLSADAEGNVRLKTLIRYLFPPAEYVRPYYNYSLKHKWLLPFAYLNRISDALFKRGNKSLNTLNEIINIDESNLTMKRINDALNITELE